MRLVIVESPTKAKTIARFLGRNFKVESSYGHIRDLPKSKLGIEVEHDFEPQYVIPTKSRKRVTALKKDAERAETVILATDLDREGEAIAWHLAQALGLETGTQSQEAASQRKKSASRGAPAAVQRIVFHEITESAIEEALRHPRDIDMHLVNAQQARRVLDRLVGYKLSPFLWKKVMSRLSAGRVQSVALRLIAEREEEIRNFKPEEYWTVSALLRKEKGKTQDVFETFLAQIDGANVPKLGVKTEADATALKAELEQCAYEVKRVERKEARRHPLPPFTTSTLQQEASRRMRFSSKQTMRVAQNLYEAGLITYMRTDSVNLSKESVAAAQQWIEEELGSEYAASAPRFFKTKSRLAQEAHEAIRPTQPQMTPERFTGEAGHEKKLYELIWRRFVASQLPSAVFDAVRVEIEARGSKTAHRYLLVASGTALRFDGFLRIWQSKFEEKTVPALDERELLALVSVDAGQHFTEPPARYNEAGLVKALELYGIGRPSTYAPTISVIQERNYVTKNEQRRFVPTEIGELVNKVLVEHFPEIVDIQFTAKMEEELDEIASGKEEWHAVIRNFYGPFIQHLAQKYEEVGDHKPPPEQTDEQCEKCGKGMVIKFGRFGKFLACSGFPECKNTKPFYKDLSLKNADGVSLACPSCGEGMVIRRRSKRGRFFFGCSRYPACTYASWINPLLPGVAEKK